MNIHFFDKNPMLNANYLDDVRVRKMITENFQMIASAFYRHNLPTSFMPLNKLNLPYGNSHPKHPSTLWTGDSRSNLIWLCDYTEALYNRYLRSGRTAHKAVPYNLKLARSGALEIPDVGLTPFVNCARSKELGIDYTREKDVHKAYFQYMNDRWDRDKIKLTWSGL